MSLPLLVHSKLFFNYRGKLDCCWYLGCSDSATKAKQDAYIKDMDRFGIDTITLNLFNDSMSSLFVGEFMASEINMRKYALLDSFIDRLKARNKKVFIVYFDAPATRPVKDAKYPFWNYIDRIAPFLALATKILSAKVDGFIFGIESNRGPVIGDRALSVEEVEYGMQIIQDNAIRYVDGVKVPIYVGNHEQNVRRNEKGKLYMARRCPRKGAHFIGYETMNHPVTQGNGVSVEDMVEEVKFLVDNANGLPVWVIESNSDEGSIAKAQNNAMAAIPGVVGVGGVM